MMILLAQLLCLWSGVRAQAACRVASGRCNTVAGKVPPVDTILEHGLSIEAGLPAAEAVAFEHQLGHALQLAPCVQLATRTFGERLYRALITPAPNVTAALLAAFVPQSSAWNHYPFDRSNTGWVGPDAQVIETALRSGNIREVWALMYALTKSRYLDSSVEALLHYPAVAVDAALTDRGFDAESVKQRHDLIQLTESAANAIDQSQGIPSYDFPPFESWVRFDFDAKRSGDTAAGEPQSVALWNGTREWVGGETSLMSNDPSIQPPLSAAELAYQCGVDAPCKLGWAPGKEVYRIATTPFRLAPRIAGYAQQAATLGYRAVAGPSGTTQNTMQYASYVNMGGTTAWGPILRLTMLAWMLPTDDHSLWEILLGAEPYMPAGFQIRGAESIQHLHLLCPPGQTLTTPPPPTNSSGERQQTFSCDEIWKGVGAHVTPPSSWSAIQRAAWDKLVPGSGHDEPVRKRDSSHDGDRTTTTVVVLLVLVCVLLLGGVGFAARKRRQRVGVQLPPAVGEDSIYHSSTQAVVDSNQQSDQQSDSFELYS